MFPVVQIKEKSRQLPEQRQERASEQDEQEDEDMVRKPWAHKEGETKDLHLIHQMCEDTHTVSCIIT